MPSQVATNKRYAAAGDKGFTVSECAKNVEADFGKIDIIVHSLANGPEVTKPLLETSRKVSWHFPKLLTPLATKLLIWVWKGCNSTDATAVQFSSIRCPLIAWYG